MGSTLSKLETACSRVGRSRQSGTSRWPRGRQLILALAGVVLALGPIACSADQSAATPTPSAPGEAAPSEAAPDADLGGSGTLGLDLSSNAITYDPNSAPVGARLALSLVPSDGTTTARFTVSGLQPNRGYAVHLHARPCGPTGDAAGPHFQHHVDPAATPDQPSHDPQYANPDNEVWLDIHTDANGSATYETEVPFGFTDRTPASLVVHEQPQTSTGPGEAGKAGDRIACLTLPQK